jgi:hypothetical protein
MLTSEPINGKRISDLMQTVSDAETLESVGLTVGPTNVVEMDMPEHSIEIKVTEIKLTATLTQVSGWSQVPKDFNQFVIPKGAPVPKVGGIIRVTFEVL